MTVSFELTDLSIMSFDFFQRFIEVSRDVRKIQPGSTAYSLATKKRHVFVPSISVYKTIYVARMLLHLKVLVLCLLGCHSKSALEGRNGPEEAKRWLGRSTGDCM